jgi:hypothetical protein
MQVLQTWGEKMESSGQLHAPAALDREETSVPTTYCVFDRSERYEEEIAIPTWQESSNDSSVVHPVVYTLPWLIYPAPATQLIY